MMSNSEFSTQVQHSAKIRDDYVRNGKQRKFHCTQMRQNSRCPLKRKAMDEGCVLFRREKGDYSSSESRKWEKNTLGCFLVLKIMGKYQID